MLKGMGVGAIVKLVLAVMVASLFVSMTTIGSLGQALQQSFDNINRLTDFTTEIDDKQTLSDLTRFVQDRAMNEGCQRVANKNSEEGYPGLEGTRLTDRPECFGGRSSILRGLTGVSPVFGPDENYMPGIYSREKFEITQNFSIDTRGYNDGDLWIENPEVMGTAFDRNIEIVAEAGKENWEEDEGGLNTKELAGTIIGGAVGGTLPGPFKALGAYAGRAIGDELSETDVAPVLVFYEEADVSDRTNLDEEEIKEGEVVLQFCQGDEGYIQGSRGSIKNDGYSDAEPLYPVIVIEESEEPTCGDIEYGRTDLLPNEVRNDGRLLHITGKTSKEHPFVRQPGKFSTKEWAFDLKRFNENQREYSDTLFGSNIEFDFESEDSETCVVGMYDYRSSAVEATGEIKIVQGTLIPYDGTFPDRDSNEIYSENLNDKTDRTLPPYPSAQNLYDQYANQGFVGGNWGSSGINNKILYDNSGERKFELYGDLLCAPHKNNQNFDNNHGQWVMCSPEYDGETKTVNQESWTCNAESGRWEQENEGPELEPAPETITLNWDDTSSNSEDWLQASDDSFTINTEEASDNIYMDWESALPNTWEEVSVTATPDRRGHLRIAGQGPDNYQSYPYFYFGGEGYTGESENIYLNDYGDNFENDFEPLTAYEPDETYTFTFNRVENSLEVKENGETVWETSDLEAFNFQKLRLWHTDGHEDTEVTIEYIEVVYPQPIESDSEEDGEQESTEDQDTEEDSENSEEQSDEEDTIDELQNTEAYSDNADTWLGDTIEINTSDSGELSWPEAENFRLRDINQAGGSPVNGCYVEYSEEIDGDENLLKATYDKGTIIERTGLLPDPDVNDIEQETDNLEWSSVELNLTEEIFTDSTAGGELRLRNETAWENRLYGEMMCAESQHHGGRDIWHLCAPGLEETMKGAEAEVDVTTYTCNTETGEWENE